MLATKSDVIRLYSHHSSFTILLLRLFENPKNARNRVILALPCPFQTISLYFFANPKNTKN